MLRNMWRWAKINLPAKSEFGHIGNNTIIEYPCHVETPSNLFLEENTKLRNGATIINSPNEKVYIKKYTAIAANCTIITAGHKSTVGIPHFLLGSSHINDKSKDIIIEEDVWIGANVTLLSGAHLSRGCIIGAGSIISKYVPPYALVVGPSAKILKVKFSLDDILEHEKNIYPPSERLSKEDLKIIFEKYYQDVPVFGVNSILSDEEKIKVLQTKKRLHFIEPEIGGVICSSNIFTAA